MTDLISIFIISDKYCVKDMHTGAIYRLCSVPVESFDLSHLQQFNDAGLGDCAMLRTIISKIACNATVNPGWLRIMLDDEPDLDPEHGLDILKKMTTHMEGQKRLC